MENNTSYNDDDVREAPFGDLTLCAELDKGVYVAGDTRTFLVQSVDHEMIYLDCPLCGDRGSIYGGNRFYTQACCYFGAEREQGNISLEVERWTAEQLLAGESIGEVHTTLTGLRSGTTPTRRDYVERIHAILHDTRTAGAYKHYLETGDDGSWGEAGSERDYYANEETMISAEEDIAHEKAADAVELSAADSEEGL